MAQPDGNDTAAVIVDCGSLTCRAGFAGEDEPRAIFPAVVGRPKKQVHPLSSSLKDLYIGREAEAKKDILNRKWPVEYGFVTNWEDMEKIWHHTFYDELQVVPEEHPVLLTEHPMSPTVSREKLAQEMFEKFEVPALYLLSHPVASLIAAGITTGLVLDVGHGSIHTIPVYEGHVLRHKVSHVDFAGSTHSEFMFNLLRKRGYPFETIDDVRIAKDIKEKMCYVALDFEREMEIANSIISSTITEHYTLPDGQVVTVAKERFVVPELFFDPNLMELEMPGIHEVIQNTVMKCDVDIRNDLLANIVLSGGPTMYPGLSERLQKELTTLFPSSADVKVTAPRKHSTWVGGSMLAIQSPLYGGLWVSKDEYDEYGPRIVFRRCF
ncbi:actin-2-like [Diadema setosum]|uniref:actin-2-like n=1 Tax=Diadema setosum TaxID=31175 RepID=UPI003B3B44E3